jgi:hypothetical protein
LDTLRVPDTIRVRAPVRFCAGGDVTLGTNLDTMWAKSAARKLRAEYGLLPVPDSLLAPLRPLLAEADVVLLNVEGAIGVGRAPQKCGVRAKNCYAFRQPVATAAALRRLVDSAMVVGNVANNHAHDAGDQGLIASIAHLERAGVLVTGADTLATRVVTRRGDTLAFLGFHTSADAPDARDLIAVRRHVARAAQEYGIVIVTMHLGAEGPTAQRTRAETEMFLGTIDRGNPVAFADAAFEAGATLVVGHGPHVLRAAEWRGDRLVLYSLGNLLTYGPFRLAEPLNRGAIACVSIDSARHVSAAELHSTVQLAPGVLRIDSTARAAVLVDSLSALDFPESGARVGPDGRFLRDTGSAPGAPRAKAGLPNVRTKIRASLGVQMIEQHRVTQTARMSEVDRWRIAEEVTRRLSTSGIHAALGYLNERTRFRFTGIYRPDPPVLRNLYLFDRENPGLNVSGGESVLNETYCAIVCAATAPFSTSDAGGDPRLRDHAARDSVVSYAGVPIRDSSGCVAATLCHFDVRPRLVPVSEIPILEVVAPVLAGWLNARAS